MKFNDIDQIPEAGDIVGLEFGDVMIESKFVEYLDDGIVVEMAPKGEQLLKEFLPLIPAAVWAGGAAWSAYDAWQAKKAYDRGEITKGQLAGKIGTDAALTIIGGGIAKGAVKATKAVAKMFKKKPDVKIDTPDVKIDTPAVKAKVDTPAVKAKVDTPAVTVPNTVANKSLTKTQRDAFSGTGGAVAGKTTSKVVKKKADDIKKKTPVKKKKKFGKGLGGSGLPNQTIDTNLAGVTQKYGFGGLNASVQYEDKDEPSLKGFDAKTQAEIVKLKARYPQAENLLSALLADVAASKSSGQNTDHRQDIKFKDLEKRLYDLEQKLNSKVTEELTEAEYQGRKVKLGKPMRGDVKKFKVYVKDPKTGNVKKVNFGHGGTSAKSKGEKTMKIKKSNPARRKSFRARHNCDNPGPRTKARYWSCRAW
jgi:hypothetical protein